MADHTFWTDLFVLKLPVMEKILRPIIVYAAMVVMLRVFGKRELAQLNPFDLVVLLCLSNTVQNAIIGDDNTLVGGLIGATALLCMNYVTVRFLFRHRRLDQILEGRPSKLMVDGKIQPSELAKELMTKSELLSVAHKQGFESLRDVKDCTLEPGGVFFITGKVPTGDQSRHDAVMAKLDELQKQVAELKARG